MNASWEAPGTLLHVAVPPSLRDIARDIQSSNVVLPCLSMRNLRFGEDRRWDSSPCWLAFTTDSNACLWVARRAQLPWSCWRSLGFRRCLRLEKIPVCNNYDRDHVLSSLSSCQACRLQGVRRRDFFETRERRSAVRRNVGTARTCPVRKARRVRLGPAVLSREFLSGIEDQISIRDRSLAVEFVVMNEIGR